MREATERHLLNYAIRRETAHTWALEVTWYKGDKWNEAGYYLRWAIVEDSTKGTVLKRGVKNLGSSMRAARNEISDFMKKLANENQ